LSILSRNAIVLVKRGYRRKVESHTSWMATAFRSEIRQPKHFVQFCETDAFLMNSLYEFIGNGLRAGEVCIVLATQTHRESLVARNRGKRSRNDTDASSTARGTGQG
jgi:hypothetical protein